MAVCMLMGLALEETLMVQVVVFMETVCLRRGGEDGAL